MSGAIKLVMGRERKTVAIHPSEADYIDSVRRQMVKIEKNLKKVVDHIEGVTPDAMRFGLVPIFDRSQELVPVDTYRLKNSGFIEVRQVTAGAQAVVGYGRYGRPHYATVVHERLDLRHAKGKQAKFLEAAVNEFQSTYLRRVGLFIAQSMGG